MQNYFRVPIKNGYLDINTAEDTPIKVVYGANTEFVYVSLDYKTKKENWELLTQEEFEAKLAEFVPLEIDAG